jgi:hypothetical protein
MGTDVSVSMRVTVWACHICEHGHAGRSGCERQGAGSRGADRDGVAHAV